VTLIARATAHASIRVGNRAVPDAELFSFVVGLVAPAHKLMEVHDAAGIVSAEANGALLGKQGAAGQRLFDRRF